MKTSSTSSQCFYTEEQDVRMIEEVLSGRGWELPGSWNYRLERDGENIRFANRTWQGLREGYLKRIIPIHILYCLTPEGNG